MAKEVTLKNGAVIKFANEPTANDIAEAERLYGGGGTTAPAPKKSSGILGKAQSAVDWLGGGKIGEAIGTQAAKGKFGSTVQSFMTGLSKEQLQDETIKKSLADEKGPSAKQLVGDTISIASNFIPVGKAYQGAKALLRVKNLPKGAGVIKNVGNFLKRGAAMTGTGAGTGYIAETSRDVAEDNENAFKIGGGTILGAGLPVAGWLTRGTVRRASDIADWAKGLKRSVAGINPQIARVLDELPNKSKGKFDTYIKAAQERTDDIRKSSPIGLAAEKLELAGQKLKSKISAAGKAVGEAKKGAAKNPIDDISDVMESFASDVRDKFGVAVEFTGRGVKVGKIKDSLRKIGAGEMNRIRNAARDLAKLAKRGTAGDATQIMQNLDELVDYSKSDQFGVVRDPLEGTLKMIRGQLNNKVRQSSSALAKANDTFSALKDAEEWIASTAGKELQRGELLLRRVFSGDKSREALGVLDVIKKETGIDLVEDAVLARFAIDNFGDQAQKTLLEQVIRGGIEGGGRGIIMKGIDATLGAIGRKIADPEVVARRIMDKGAYNPNAIQRASEIARQLTGFRGGNVSPGDALVDAYRRLLGQ